jgi:Ca-activated chloride channel family protein
MLFEVGERIIEGEIREREAATRVYQQARQAGRTAGLVEQERANQFVTRLANIGPGEEIRVLIGFLVDVAWQDGAFSLRLPTTFNRRFGDEPQPGTAQTAAVPLLTSTSSVNDHHLDLEIDLRTDLPLASVESRYHDVLVNAVPNGYRVQLADLARSDRDFELVWRPEASAMPQASLLAWDSGEALYAQLMLVPPAEQTLQALPREVVFVIDTSGSMDGASLAQARAALALGLEQLDGKDYFNLLQFNSHTEQLFTTPVPANALNLQKAREYIQRLAANGGTEMAPALEAALIMPSRPGLMRQVVFITDGSVGNERQLLGQVAEQLGATRMFPVSIGSAPNGWFMRKMAEIGRGSHTHIGQLDEVSERMTLLWDKIRTPAITDICIDWGVPAEYYPEVIPDLYAGTPLWVVARLPEVPSQVSLCGELNGAGWSFAAVPDAEAGSKTLATAWAQRKVEALQDSVSFGASAQDMALEITQVALDYGLLTQHTALVAVDRTPARPALAPLATGNVPSLLPAGSSAHSAGFPRTATGWKLQLGLSLFAFLLASAMFFRPAGFRRPVVATGLSASSR